MTKTVEKSFPEFMTIGKKLHDRTDEDSHPGHLGKQGP
jgi:hypothetical protein